MKKLFWISLSILAIIGGIAVYLNEPEVKPVEAPSQVYELPKIETVQRLTIPEAPTVTTITTPIEERKQDVVEKAATQPPPQAQPVQDSVVAEEKQRLPAPPYLEPELRVEGNLGGPPPLPDFGLLSPGDNVK